MHLRINHLHSKLPSCLHSLTRALLHHKLLWTLLLNLLRHFPEHPKSHSRQPLHFRNCDRGLLVANSSLLHPGQFRRISVRVDWELLDLRATYMYFGTLYSFWLLSCHLLHSLQHSTKQKMSWVYWEQTKTWSHSYIYLWEKQYGLWSFCKAH